MEVDGLILEVEGRPQFHLSKLPKVDLAKEGVLPDRVDIAATKPFFGLSGSKSYIELEEPS